MPAKAVTENLTEEQFKEKIRQLTEQLEEAQRRNAEQDIILKATEARVEKMQSDQAGWLVTTPNIFYDGVTMNIQFSNGQAFVPDSRVFDRFVIKPLKPTELAKMSKEAQKQFEERSKLPSSFLAVQSLHNDFGYTIEHFDGDSESLQKIVSDRTAERAKLQAILDQQGAGSAKADNLMQPQRFGVVPGG